jgi:hypothetical protein
MRYKGWALFAFLIVLPLTSSAQSSVIDFRQECVGHSNDRVYYDFIETGGYRFSIDFQTSSSDMRLLCGPNSGEAWTGLPHIASQYFGPIERYTMTRIDGRPFSIESIDLLAINNYQSTFLTPVRFWGYLAGGGTIEQSFLLPPFSFAERNTYSFAPAFKNLTQLEFDVRREYGFTNVHVTVTPEPATLTLFGLGLASIAAARRSRRRVGV